MTDASDNTPMDRPVPDEILMAYVDGELSAGERKAVEAALARDASLVQTVTSFVYTRGPLPRPYDAVLTAPIPYRLLAFSPMPGRRSDSAHRDRPAPRNCGGSPPVSGHPCCRRLPPFR